MASARLIVVLALAVVANAKDEPEMSPATKVVELLEDMKAKSEEEGRTEAASYDAFACFCKETTEAKSGSITGLQDDVDQFAADIGSKEALKVEKEDKELEAKQKIEETKILLQQATDVFNRDKAVFEAKDADLSKALGSTTRSLRLLSAPATPAASSFLSVGTKSDVKIVLSLADALGLVHPEKAKAIGTLLQTPLDASDPEYKMHSGEIVRIVTELEADFSKQRGDARTEWVKTRGAYTGEQTSMGGIVTTAEGELETLAIDIGGLKEQIAAKKIELLEAQGSLGDDSTYLKDLTERCQQKGQEWDQRTKMRHNEVSEIDKALTLLETVTDHEHLNKRHVDLSLVQTRPAVHAKANAARAVLARAKAAEVQKKAAEVQKKAKKAAMAVAAKAAMAVAAKAAKVAKAAKIVAAKAAAHKPRVKPAQAKAKAVFARVQKKAKAALKKAALAKAALAKTKAALANTKAKHMKHEKLDRALLAKKAALAKAALAKAKAKAAHPKSVHGKVNKMIHKKSSLLQTQSSVSREVHDLLHDEAVRLNSKVLSSLANKIQADPFVKVKKLIQGLTERLLAESKSEATKTGFCNAELAKSMASRDAQYAQINKINAETAALRAEEDVLRGDLAMENEALETLREGLNETQEDREENEETLADARLGIKATAQALTLLGNFFKTAAKASLVQTSASPVDEDTQGAGFKGTYKGKQDSSRAILALLETIQADYERTIKTTEAGEAKGAAEAVTFERALKANIAAKEKNVELVTEDLDNAKGAAEVGLRNMQTAQGLVDGALQTIAQLKPTCIDTGMSYADRVLKRESEIRALEQADEMLKTADETDSQ